MARQPPASRDVVDGQVATGDHLARTRVELIEVAVRSVAPPGARARSLIEVASSRPRGVAWADPGMWVDRMRDGRVRRVLVDQIGLPDAETSDRETEERSPAGDDACQRELPARRQDRRAGNGPTVLEGSGGRPWRSRLACRSGICGPYKTGLIQGRSRWLWKLRSRL